MLEAYWLDRRHGGRACRLHRLYRVPIGRPTAPERRRDMNRPITCAAIAPGSRSSDRATGGRKRQHRKLAADGRRSSRSSEQPLTTVGTRSTAIWRTRNTRKPIRSRRRTSASCKKSGKCIPATSRMAAVKYRSRIGPQRHFSSTIPSTFQRRSIAFSRLHPIPARSSGPMTPIRCSRPLRSRI